MTLMFRSFKLKMALFSLCTSGAILLAFASLFMSAIRRAGLERIDRQLHMLAEGQMRRPPDIDRWSRFDESLSAFSGVNNRRSFAMKIIGAREGAIYTSPNWPAALDAQALLADAPAQHAPSFDEPPPNKPDGDFHSADADAPRERFDEPPHDRMRAMRPDGLPPHKSSPLGAPHFTTVRAGSQNWRFIVMRSPTRTLCLGSDMSELQAELRRFTVAYAIAVPLGLLLLATGGWLLARQALIPVQELTRVAASITAKGLDQRVQAEDADQEFEALISVINDMLNRLEVSFRQAARFSADAAHELKTPLTILQGQLNQALHNVPDDSPEQHTYADLLEEVQRLKTIVRKLLLLAQSDAGQLRLSLAEISLDQELGAFFEDLPLLAPGLTLHKDIEPNVRVRADPDLLRQVLQNLISNAVKYNLERGTLACALHSANGLATLSVSNTVAGDVTIDRTRIFDRFYRGDAAHNRKIDGTGLGLSLAREISRAHGGDLTVENAPEGWITFRLTLPLAPADARTQPTPT